MKGVSRPSLLDAGAGAGAGRRYEVIRLQTRPQTRTLAHCQPQPRPHVTTRPLNGDQMSASRVGEANMTVPAFLIHGASGQNLRYPAPAPAQAEPADVNTWKVRLCQLAGGRLGTDQARLYGWLYCV